MGIKTIGTRRTSVRKTSSHVERARSIASSRNEILKAQVFAARAETGTAPQPDEADPTWEGIGALAPPYEPYVLLTLFENSNSLRQCVDAYVTNIDGNGHRFDPVLDLKAADADERIKTYLLARASKASPEIITDPVRQLPEPTEEQIEQCKKELMEKMRSEHLRIQHWFEYSVLDTSFVSLRRKTRQDLEIQGNAYWEVMRDEDGKLAGFEYVPSFTVRHFASDKKSTPVSYRVKENEFDYTVLPARKFFRRFVQVFEARVIWFKEFGDPRVVSRTSGRYFKTVEDLHLEEPHADPASEIIHFNVHTSKTSYGIPRWIGCFLSVIGSRHAEEVNLAYFENKSVPPLAVLVSGGRISNDTVKRITDFIENDVKGKNNFHKILVLEGEAPGGGSFDQGRLKIDLKPLTSAQHSDALFQNYDERNIDKVGMSFRLSRMLRGDIRDFNRATAEAALEFAETQVFKPERDEFDFMINRRILPALGIRFWTFKSNTASAQNPKDLTEIMSKLGQLGWLTPAEGRDLVPSILNRPLQKINAPWTRQPLQLTLNGIVPPDDLIAPGMVSPQTAATGPEGAALPMLTMPAGATPAQAVGGLIAQGSPAGGSVKLTGTDAASVVTVNEAREDMGKGPLKLPPDKGGGDDPDGYLTVAEFKARRMALGQTQGTAEGQAQPLAPSASKSMRDTILSLLEIQKASDMLAQIQAEQAFAKNQDALSSAAE